MWSVYRDPEGKNLTIGRSIRSSQPSENNASGSAEAAVKVFNIGNEKSARSFSLPNNDSMVILRARVKELEDQLEANGIPTNCKVPVLL